MVLFTLLFITVALGRALGCASNYSSAVYTQIEASQSILYAYMHEDINWIHITMYISG